MFDVLIKNGLVVTHDNKNYIDIGISDGKITSIGSKGSLKEAHEIIDAEGLIVMPGIIDPHTHIKHPYKDSYSADDFYTATRSAAFGGTTSLIDFAIQWDKEKPLIDTIEDRNKQFLGEAVIDFALHACPTVSSTETIDEMPEIINAKSPSFKMYMTYSKQNRMSEDGVIFNGLKQTAKYGGILGVHAENDFLVNFNTEYYVNMGLTSPKYFPIAKDNIVEAEAINRVVYLNREAKGNLYIFHLSTKEGLEIVAQAKSKGEKVTAETCVHYLVMDKSYYEKHNGENFICSPPLRSKDDQDALWKGINNGTISIISTDHCGFSLADKAVGNGEFHKTPNGLPGIELLLPLVYTYGVKDGKININKLVEILSTNTAKTFGMYPQKGAIQIGSDADIVIMDPREVKTVSTKILDSPVDWSPYEGMELQGFAKMTISKGKVIVDNGKFLGEKGMGNFIEREIL